MVAGMYANFFVREKIVQIYSNDGPGLLKEQLESSYYKNIENKFVHIIPNYSVVGLLLEHSDNYEVVRSARKSIWSHDLATWVVKDREFERAILSPYSEVLDVELDKWLSQYDQETRKNFVISLFEIFDRADIYTLVDLMKNKRLIFRLITESKEMEDETKEILKDFVSVLFRCFKDVTKEELLALFDKN